MYLISIILFMLVLPVAFITGDYVIHHLPIDISLIGKWFLFWAVGVRLFIAGCRQITKPAFTAKEIFHIKDPGSFAIVRELGFANVCMGVVAIISLFQPDWRMASATGGGLYFGLAGFLHVFKKPDSRNEVIAMVSDFFIFLIMTLYVFSRVFAF